MSKIINIESEKQLNEIIAQDKKVLVDFKAEWCGPCKMLHPLIEELAEKRDDVIFAQVDVDQNRDLASKYEVMSIPSLKVFSNQQITKEAIGFMSTEKIEEMLK